MIIFKIIRTGEWSDKPHGTYLKQIHVMQLLLPPLCFDMFQPYHHLQQHGSPKPSDRMAPTTPAGVTTSQLLSLTAPLSPSLLFLILDIHPLSWHLLAQPPTQSSVDHTSSRTPPLTSLDLSDFLNILMVFLNAHLAARWGNEVVVYAATAGKS